MIAAKNKVLESAIKSMLELNCPDDKIFVTAGSISFFERLGRMTPDLILLDWEFFNSKTEEHVKHVKKDYPHINLICMDIHNENIKNALEASADAFFFKSDPPGELLNLIKSFRYYK
jgi:DNA-binding NarL/FixJ family response regulator